MPDRARAKSRATDRPIIQEQRFKATATCGNAMESTNLCSRPNCGDVVRTSARGSEKATADRGYAIYVNYTT